MRKKVFLIVPLLWVLCIDVCAQIVERYLTIEEMFQLTEQNNSRIKAHTMAVRQARQEVKVAKNAFLPSIEASLSLSYNGDGTILDRDFGNSINAPIPDFGNNFAIEVSQVLYSGGAISSAVRLSELQAQIVELDAVRGRQQVRFLIVGNYLELCKLNNQLRVFDRHIAQTEELLGNMRVRYSEGAALQNDITRYELQLQTLQYSRSRMRNTAQILNNQLTVAMGLPSNTTILTDTVINIASLECGDAEGWQERALHSSSAVLMARKGVEISREKKRLSSSERLPKVALFAVNNLTAPVTIEIPALNKNFNYWAVGVGVKYSLGNLYKSGKKIKADKLGIQKAQEDARVAQEQTLLDVQAAYINYRDACTLLETKEKSVQLAVQNYNVVSYRYANNLALITDLLDAATQRLDAELQTVNARINILYNYYKLHYISGTL